jgi:hypothetical protein
MVTTGKVFLHPAQDRGLEKSVPADVRAFRTSLTQQSGATLSVQDLLEKIRRAPSIPTELYNDLARSASGAKLSQLFTALNQVYTIVGSSGRGPVFLQAETDKLVSAVASYAPDNTKLEIIQALTPLIGNNDPKIRVAAADAVGQVLASLKGGNFDKGINGLNVDQLGAVARGGYRRTDATNVDVTESYSNRFISILTAAAGNSADRGVKQRLVTLANDETSRVANIISGQEKKIQAAVTELLKTMR